MYFPYVRDKECKWHNIEVWRRSRKRKCQLWTNVPTMLKYTKHKITILPPLNRQIAFSTFTTLYNHHYILLCGWIIFHCILHITWSLDTGCLHPLAIDDVTVIAGSQNFSALLFPVPLDIFLRGKLLSYLVTLTSSGTTIAFPSRLRISHSYTAKRMKFLHVSTQTSQTHHFRVI